MIEFFDKQMNNAQKEKNFQDSRKPTKKCVMKMNKQKTTHTKMLLWKEGVYRVLVKMQYDRLQRTSGQ